MELLNATRMLAGYTMGMQPDGRELLVVAVKGTYTIPLRGERPELAENQVPLIEADTFTGEPGHSAPCYEVDYAPIKQRCDVLLVGSAYAPKGKPTTRVQVGMKVGQIGKTFNVVGNRVWEAGYVSRGPSYTGKFDRMPISYDHAFGGVDDFHEDKSRHSTYMLNPIGKGYHREVSGLLIDGTPMPNTEEINDPVKHPNGDYKPMAFGPIGRGWESRYKYAGTYDQNWLDNVFPFLPKDFNDAYYQAAPVDQQMPCPKGGEVVMLVNLTPEGRTAFKLPTVHVPIVFFRKDGDRHETQGKIDTIVLEPDKRIFTITWRASVPLKRNMFEIPQIVVGRMSRAWWRARELGKTYYPSLKHLTDARRRETEEEEA